MELDGQDAEQTVSHYALRGGKLKRNAFKKLYTRSRRERSLTIPLFPSEQEIEIYYYFPIARGHFVFMIKVLSIKLFILECFSAFS